MSAGGEGERRYPQSERFARMNRVKTRMRGRWFSVADEQGNFRRWRYFRDAGGTHYWFIDHEGHERHGGGSWKEFAAKANLVAANYGFTCELS